MTISISQKQARDLLGSPETFRGGAFITRNGSSELFIQTAEERDAEVAERGLERQANALLKLAALSQLDIQHGRYEDADEYLKRRRAARNK